MIPPTITNFFIYCGIVWGTNIFLNMLGMVKRFFPQTMQWDWPIDGGLMYRGDRLVGESTTVVGLVICIVLSLVLYICVPHSMWVGIPVLVYCGHMLGSFIKRRMHKKGGEFVPFIDHGDYVLCAGCMFLILHYIGFPFFFLSLIVTYIVHPIACFLAFKLNVRERPY